MRVLSGLLTVMGVTMMSSTIVSVALPQIIGSLKGTQSQYTWVVTAMLLTSTASTPLWGRLADLFSKKLLLQIGIVIFLLASLGAGFSQNTGQLIAFRAVQGLGMGSVQVMVQVVIAAMISPKERGRYNGYLGGVMAVATVGGPLLGGVITDSALGWRWCFFLPLPFIVISFLLLQWTLHLPHARRDDVKVDYAGASLIAAGVSVLLVWITFVGDSFAWPSWQTGAMVGASALLLGLAVWVETRAAQPVVPVHIVRQRTPALAIIGSAAVGMAMFGGAVFLGQYYQIGRGYSPTQAGLLTIPMMAGVMVASTISGRIISVTGKVRPFVIAGLAVLSLGFALMSTIDHETSLLFIGAAMVLVGAGVGMSMQNLVLIVQNGVSMRDMGAASGAMAFFRSLGGTIGVSVLGAILAARVADSIREGFAKVGVQVSDSQGGSLDVAAIPEPLRVIVRAAYGDGTGHIFLVSTGIALVGLVAVLFLKPPQLRASVDLHEEEPAPIAPAEPLETAGTARVRRRRPGRAGWWSGAVAACVAVAVALTLVARGGGDEPEGDGGGRVAESARTAGQVLQAAAAAAERQTPSGGRYLHTSLRSTTLVSAGTSRSSFLIVQDRLTDRWQAARPSRDASLGWTRRLAARPLTAADRRAWKAAGSPSRVAGLEGTGKPVSLKPTGAWRKSRTAAGRTGKAAKAGTLGGGSVTMGWLNGLPADPDGLRASLLARYRGGASGTGLWLFTAARDLLDGSLPVHPEVRGAAYRMLSGLDGVALLGPVRDPDGRQGTGIALDEPGAERGAVRHTLVLDEGTGLLLAASDVLLEPAPAYERIPAGTAYASTVYRYQSWTDGRPVAPKP